MKFALISLFCIVVISCKEVPKEIKTALVTPKSVVEINDSKYPEALHKVFNAHGGLKTWKNKRVLTFEIAKPNTKEKHTIDLYSRNEKIEMSGITMGSEGTSIWLLDDEEAYKGNPVFYHNLMFYFFAMPFVLSDDGINYTKADDLKFEGKSYPGFQITFNDGIGLSSKDEYYIHYNQETFQMEWLGYTVTFKSGEKSNNIKWVRYHDWINVDDLKLPNSLTWHEYEGKTIKAPEEPLYFENVTLSESALPANFFSKPEGANIIE